jgi:hypothetical protein
MLEKEEMFSKFYVQEEELPWCRATKPMIIITITESKKFTEWIIPLQEKHKIYLYKEFCSFLRILNEMTSYVCI